MINPPERILYEGFKYYLPFPLLYLAAYLEANGMDTEIVDIKSVFERSAAERDKAYSQAIDKIVEETLSHSPGLIGISCMTNEYDSVMKTASLLKARSKTPIAVGGIHPSLYPEQFIYGKSLVDFVIIGEGEETLLELARSVKSGRTDYEGVAGIAYLNGGGMRLTGIRTVTNDLSVSPINMYRKLDMGFYTKPHLYVMRYLPISGVQILTSRGCHYDCIFCSNAAIRKMNRMRSYVRHRPVRSVVEEIKFLRDTYNIDGFYIMDDTFCIEKRHVYEFR